MRRPHPKAHLIGVAGSGMRALAEVLLGRGYQISGSDNNPAPSLPLARGGCRIWKGHAAAHVERCCNLAIYSDAVDEANCERQAAVALDIPAISYSQMLGRLMEDTTIGVAVAGTHGKSTTTAMAAEILVHAGLDPTVVLGAEPLGSTTGGRAGRGQIVLVEACEYRRNFLHLHPTVAVLLGIEADHFDCYASTEAVEAAFAQLAKRVPPQGLLLAHAGCAATIRAAHGGRARLRTFGLADGADWQARGLVCVEGRYAFTVFRDGWPLLDVRLRVPGRHNVLNALAAAALAGELGVSAEQIGAALSSFQGLRRRLEVVENSRGVTLIDDYAHHPTAVAATLASVREMFPGRPLRCVFEPHQASRTRHLLDAFAGSLQNVDRVHVADIYRARESRAADRGDVTADDLASAVRGAGCRKVSAGRLEWLIDDIAGDAAANEVIVTAGAGRIRNFCHALADRLRRNRSLG